MLDETKDLYKLSAEYADPLLFKELLRKVGVTEHSDMNWDNAWRYFPILEADVHRFLAKNNKYRGFLGRVFYTLCRRDTIFGLLQAEFRRCDKQQRSCFNCGQRVIDKTGDEELEDESHLRVIRDLWISSQTMCR